MLISWAKLVHKLLESPSLINSWTGGVLISPQLIQMFPQKTQLMNQKPLILLALLRTYHHYQQPL